MRGGCATDRGSGLSPARGTRASGPHAGETPALPSRHLRRARALAFYAGYAGVTVFWATLSLAVAWALPLPARFHFIVGGWTRIALWWLRVTCGVGARVRGREHLPATPCILLVKHQSTWETLWVQTLARPQTTLIKRELLRIPFWGWAFALTRPIAIDRGSPKAALRQFIETGTDRLRRGMTVTLFPEGTRLPPGAQRKFHRGGAALAAATGVPVVVIAHNAGAFWPPRTLAKRPGLVDVVISPPVETRGKRSSEINALCEQWLSETMAAIEAPARKVTSQTNR